MRAEGTPAFRLLGPLTISAVDAGESQPSGLLAALLTVLLLEANRFMSTDVLSDRVWGDATPGANAVQAQISRLRKVLPPVAVIVAHRGGYELVVDPLLIDVGLVNDRLSQARKRWDDGDARATSVLARDALGAWRGEPLAGMSALPFVVRARTELSALRTDAMRLWWMSELAQGNHRELAGDVAAVMADLPLDDELWRLALLTLYRSGRQADALSWYEKLRRRLADELGVYPSSSLADLHVAILNHDPEIDGFARVTTTPRSLLPVLLDETVGRDEELTALRTLTCESDARLITVLGPGGVGKSRLALELARVASATFPDGVVFVPLAEATKPGDVVPALCAAFGVRAGEGAAASLEAAVAAQQVLLICDNFEHVISAAPVLVTLLAAAPGLRIVVTSRQLLGVRGERSFVLDPLPAGVAEGVSAAGRLFLVRAKEIDHRFDPGAVDLANVEVIAARCDGLPLAVELAAASTRLMSLTAVRDRLTAPLSLPGQRSSDRPDRHRTLRANIAWSVGALSREQVRFLSAMTVFRGGFTPEAAAYVAGIDLDTAWGEIETLCVSSLIRRKTGVVSGRRFDMLETIREYAAELQEPPDRDESRERHARYFREWLDPGPEPEFQSASIQTRLEQLQERPNLREATRWSLVRSAGDVAADLLIGAAELWRHDGSRPDVVQWLGQLLDRDDVPVGRRCDALLWQAYLWGGEDPARMLEPLRQAMAIAVELADDRRIGWALYIEANRAYFTQDTAGALAAAREGYAHALRLPDAANLHAAVLSDLGVFASCQDDLATAVEHTERALVIAREHSLDLRAVIVLNNISEFRMEEGNAEEARRLASEGYELAMRAQSSFGSVAHLAQRGYASLMLGRVDEAVADLREAVVGEIRVGESYFALHALERLAAAIAASRPEWAAVALSVVDSSPTFVEEAVGLQARERYLGDLPDRVGAGYPALVERGRALVAQHGTSGAILATLALLDDSQRT